MTLEELKIRCENAGLQYAYGKFLEEVEPPHLIAVTMDTDNFMAENRVYFKETPIKLDYTYIEKDLIEQNKIENEILGDVAWNKSDEAYLPDEKVWQVSYFFRI